METKQVIVVRKDLKMRKGKLAAQVAHASMKVFFDMMTETHGLISEPLSLYAETDTGERSFHLKLHKDTAIYDWVKNQYTKIVVSVESEAELLEVYTKAKMLKLPCSLIKDAGRTEFKEPTHTCVAVGPARVAEVDAITKDLKLL